MQHSPPVAQALVWRNLVAASLLFASALAWSAKTAEWTPPSPMPDKCDWVQLTSGEWLKGAINVIYQDSLEFDSDKLGPQRLDLADVKTIRSAQIVSVRMIGDKVVTGKLLLDDGRIEVLGDTAQAFQRDELLSVTAGVPKRNYWSGKVSVGGDFSSGNSDQKDVNVMISAKRRTVEDRIELDYLGNYSIAHSAQSANNHRANAVWDRFVSAKAPFGAQPAPGAPLQYTLQTPEAAH
jgi:hypothetical protein